MRGESWHVARGKPNDQIAPVPRYTAQACRADLTAHRVQYDVGSKSTRKRLDRVDPVFIAVVDAVICAVRPRRAEPVFTACRCNHRRTARRRHFDRGQPNPAGSYIENTIIIQYDPQVQEVWDQARKLKCTWYDYYEKSVTFKPFQVNMLNAVTANFLGDSLQCWMQVQVGKGPWAGEVSGIVKIGQTMTMVLGIKDDDGKFDMLVRNCVAHDGKKAPIQARSAEAAASST